MGVETLGEAYMLGWRIHVRDQDDSRRRAAGETRQ
jgi:hypothetical protein